MPPLLKKERLLPADLAPRRGMSRSARRRVAYSTAAVASVGLAALAIWAGLPTAPPRLLDSAPITSDGRDKSTYWLLTDGLRVYFEEESGVLEVPVKGGETASVGAPSHFGPTDISPDGLTLAGLVSNGKSWRLSRGFLRLEIKPWDSGSTEPSGWIRGQGSLPGFEPCAELVDRTSPAAEASHEIPGQQRPFLQPGQSSFNVFALDSLLARIRA